MGHEVIIYGHIEGATWRGGEQFTWLHELNGEVLAQVPDEDDWPWVTRGIFALPAPYPRGTYRAQIIHFGLSLKDEPGDRGVWDVWLAKFEAVLIQMYWFRAVVHLETEFEPSRVLTWVPTDTALEGCCGESPQPITEWVRSVRVVEESKKVGWV